MRSLPFALAALAAIMPMRTQAQVGETHRLVYEPSGRPRQRAPAMAPGHHLVSRRARHVRTADPDRPGSTPRF
jgi:hypothetical protein